MKFLVKRSGHFIFRNVFFFSFFPMTTINNFFGCKISHLCKFKSWKTTLIKWFKAMISSKSCWQCFQFHLVMHQCSRFITTNNNNGDVHVVDQGTSHKRHVLIKVTLLSKLASLHFIFTTHCHSCFYNYEKNITQLTL